MDETREKAEIERDRFAGKIPLYEASCIVICGQSIFAHALEAALVEAAGWEVIRLHPHLPAIVERIVGLRPLLVLLEHGEGHEDLTLALLDQGVPLVKMDCDSGQGVLFTRQLVPIASQEDVNELIAQLAPASMPFRTT